MAGFVLMKYENPKLKQSEIPNQLSYSSSTLQRYRNDLNLLSPYRIQSNNSNKRTKRDSNTNFNNDSHRALDVKRPQMTSIDLETTLTNTKLNQKNKKNSKTGSIHENVETNEHYSDESLHKNDI